MPKVLSALISAWSKNASKQLEYFVLCDLSGRAHLSPSPVEMLLRQAEVFASIHNTTNGSHPLFLTMCLAKSSEAKASDNVLL
eukprot:2844915-Karenia_brevis.AAC.1